MIRLLALLLALLPTSAWAVCPAANQFSFSFGNQTAAQLSYGSTYNYTATTTGGTTRPFSVRVAQNGMTSTTASGLQMPRIGNSHTGPGSANNLVMGGNFGQRTADLSSNTRTATAIFTFAQPVRDFTMTVNDVDFAYSNFRDWVMVTGVGNAVTYTPALTSPHGNSNATGGVRTATNSSVTFGPGTTPVTLTAAQMAGSGSAGNNSNTGTITATFAQPVTVITLRYGNAPLVFGEVPTTSDQAIGLEGFSFCPMPTIAVVKTSTPANGSLGAFDLPANDITYTLTVTNTGGSPVDAGTIVLTDVLPAATTFRNAALGTGGPFAIASGSSGVTLTSGSPSYSSDGGATWAYAPASGYDPNVKAVRVTPIGTMAPNSSFAVTFVARVK